MQFRKTLMSLTLSSLLLFFNTSFALAVNFSDIGSDYWAAKEIQALSEQNIISGYPEGTFKPDNPVNRAEFTSMVIKTLNKEDMPLKSAPGFKDITLDHWAYGNISRSAELGLVVGYPDNTFRPCGEITKSEATSILSKTIVPCECETPCGCSGPCETEKTKECVFKQFSDSDDIAEWARPSFKKAIKNNLYVNHPDENYLTPNEKLTRAETAALLYKIRQNPCIVSAEYQGPYLQEVSMAKKEAPLPQKVRVEENKTVVEHLPGTPYTDYVTEVEITGSIAKILAYNILPVKFENGLKSGDVKQDDVVYLVFNRNLDTEEGTTVLPAGSKLAAEISKLKRGKPFHINGEIQLNITNLILPSGEAYPISATIENNELLDPEFGSCNLKRLGIVSASVATFGTALGFFIGLADDLGDGTALGAILGGSIGAGLGLMWPGCGVKVPADEEIYVKLNENVDVKID